MNNLRCGQKPSQTGGNGGAALESWCGRLQGDAQCTWGQRSSSLWVERSSNSFAEQIWGSWGCQEHLVGGIIWPHSLGRGTHHFFAMNSSAGPWPSTLLEGQSEGTRLPAGPDDLEWFGPCAPSLPWFGPGTFHRCSWQEEVEGWVYLSSLAAAKGRAPQRVCEESSRLLRPARKKKKQALLHSLRRC